GIFFAVRRGGCPNDGGLRRLSRLGGGVGQEVQHATGALGAALLVDGADAPPRRRAALRRGAALLRRRRPRRYFPRVRDRRQARPRQSVHVAPQVRVDLARRLVRAHGLVRDGLRQRRDVGVREARVEVADRAARDAAAGRHLEPDGVARVPRGHERVEVRLQVGREVRRRRAARRRAPHDRRRERRDLRFAELRVGHLDVARRQALAALDVAPQLRVGRRRGPRRRRRPRRWRRRSLSAGPARDGRHRGRRRPLAPRLRRPARSRVRGGGLALVGSERSPPRRWGADREGRGGGIGPVRGLGLGVVRGRGCGPAGSEGFVLESETGGRRPLLLELL
ncbi:unnamed protein product, partial [Pelagomonas calceolata]